MNPLRRAGSVPKRAVARVWDEEAMDGKMCDQAAPVTASSYLKISETSLSIIFHSFFHTLFLLFFLWWD